MTKFNQIKSDIISLFFNESALANLFFLPIKLISFTQYSLVHEHNKSSVLELDSKTVELWQRNHEVALKDFLEFQNQLTRLRDDIRWLRYYAEKAKQNDFDIEDRRRISSIIDKMVQANLLKLSSLGDTYVLCSPNAKSPYVQFDALLKFKKIDRNLLESGRATLNDFISLTNSESKKLAANKKKLARIEKMTSENHCTGSSVFHLNLGVHPLHWEKFTQEQLQYYHQQLKIWLRYSLPHIDFVSIARSDIHKGYNIHLFFLAMDIGILYLIREKWAYLTSGCGAWPLRDYEENRQSNQAIIDIATALYFLGSIIKQ